MTNGVREYTKGIVTIEVFFPNGDILCQYCPFCFEAKDGLKRWRCQLTTELIFTPFDNVGERCPIKICKGEI